MTGYEIGIQANQHLLSHFGQLRIRQQILTDAIRQQIGRTKHLFGQHTKRIDRSLLLIVIRIFRIGNVLTHILGGKVWFSSSGH